jgi:hypothetical protein
MHPRIQEVLDHLDRHRDSLRAAVNAAREEHHERRPAPDRWSAAEVLAHLALVEERIGGLIRGALDKARAAGIGPETETTPVSGMMNHDRIVDRSRRVANSAVSAPEEGVALPDAWSRLEATRARLRDTLVDADGLALTDVTASHPVFGELNVYQWALFAGSHEARHAAQVRELANADGASAH